MNAPRNEATEMLVQIRDLLAMLCDRLPPPRILPAEAADLDGKYGDEPVKFPPKSREDLKGVRPSEMSVDDLVRLADYEQWMAGESDRQLKRDDKGRLKSEFNRKRAAIFLGWAERKKNGYRSPDDLPDDPPNDVPPPGNGDPTDDI